MTTSNAKNVESEDRTWDMEMGYMTPHLPQRGVTPKSQLPLLMPIKIYIILKAKCLLHINEFAKLYVSKYLFNLKSLPLFHLDPLVQCRHQTIQSRGANS